MTWFWSAVWPNLAANALWVPVAYAAHWWLKHRRHRHAQAAADQRHSDLRGMVEEVLRAVSGDGDDPNG